MPNSQAKVRLEEPKHKLSITMMGIAQDRADDHQALGIEPTQDNIILDSEFRTQPPQAKLFDEDCAYRNL